MNYVTMSKIGEMGRLGNSLFQISCVYGYARKHGVEPIIPPFKYADSFVGPFNQVVLAKQPPKYLEKHFHYEEIPKMDYVDLVGYYQSKKYWEHCEDEIRRKFQFKDNIVGHIQDFMLATSTSQTNIFIHVRRTDYLTMEHYYYNLTLDWYKQAIAAFGNICHFYVCSDDIVWCKANFPNCPNITFSEFGEIYDFCLMSQCTHGIMANSSFSWWGGWLINNPTKTIIAPNKWFKPIAAHDTKDLYLSNWTLLNNE